MYALGGKHRALRSVDLPLPDGPNRYTNSPLRKRPLARLRRCFSTPLTSTVTERASNASATFCSGSWTWSFIFKDGRAMASAWKSNAFWIWRIDEATCALPSPSNVIQFHPPVHPLSAIWPFWVICDNHNHNQYCKPSLLEKYIFHICESTHANSSRRICNHSIGACDKAAAGTLFGPFSFLKYFLNDFLGTISVAAVWCPSWTA